MKLPNVNDYVCNPPAVTSVMFVPGFMVIGVGTVVDGRDMNGNYTIAGAGDPLADGLYTFSHQDILMGGSRNVYLNANGYILWIFNNGVSQLFTNTSSELYTADSIVGAWQQITGPLPVPVTQSAPQTLLTSLTSETALDSALVTYASSDSTVATIVNGVITAVGPGVAYLSATYNGQAGYATIIVQPVVNGSYCSNEPIGTYLVLDCSSSMADGQFDYLFPSALTVGKLLAKALANSMNVSKDQMGLVVFDASPDLALSLTDDPPVLESAITGALPEVLREDHTNIMHAFDYALDRIKECTACVRKVLVLITDGLSNPELSDTVGGAFATMIGQKDVLIQKSKSFQSRGGVVIVVGLNTTGQNYTLLRSVATPGYFVNVLPDAVATAEAALLSLPALYCGQRPANQPPDYFVEDGGYFYDNLY